MDELAAGSVYAKSLRIELLASLRFILVRLLHCLLQFLFPMRKCALFPEFAIPHFPIQAELSLVVDLEGGSALATCHRDEIS